MCTGHTGIGNIYSNIYIYIYKYSYALTIHNFSPVLHDIRYGKKSCVHFFVMIQIHISKSACTLTSSARPLGKRGSGLGPALRVPAKININRGMLTTPLEPRKIVTWFLTRLKTWKQKGVHSKTTVFFQVSRSQGLDAAARCPGQKDLPSARSACKWARRRLARLAPDGKRVKSPESFGSIHTSYYIYIYTNNKQQYIITIFMITMMIMVYASYVVFSIFWMIWVGLAFEIDKLPSVAAPLVSSHFDQGLLTKKIRPLKKAFSYGKNEKSPRFGQSRLTKLKKSLGKPQKILTKTSEFSIFLLKHRSLSPQNLKQFWLKTKKTHPI